jgi:hypothetical protein
MVRGEIELEPSSRPAAAIAVTYNPYVTPWFRERVSDKRIDAARLVWFSIKDGKPMVEIAI